MTLDFLKHISTHIWTGENDGWVNLNVGNIFILFEVRILAVPGSLPGSNPEKMQKLNRGLSVRILPRAVICPY